MNKIKVGILGATGMVGQRFAKLLSEHPWFEISVLAASPRSSGKTYSEAISGRTYYGDMPDRLKNMRLKCVDEIESICSEVNFVFCAVNMPKEHIRTLEYAYMMNECPVISNNSAHRHTPDVPMVIPELNREHIAVIDAQRRRLGTKYGFIAVKSNCSIQSYVPLLYPLHKAYGLKSAVISTYQAVSGAGRSLSGFEEINDNIIPYIAGEDEKSEVEPLKLFGHIENGRIANAVGMDFFARCVRVPVSDGHTASVFATFGTAPDLDAIEKLWDSVKPITGLPSSPAKFIYRMNLPDRPQPRLDRDTENGMAVCAGGLRLCGENSISFTGLSHNTVRGAAGGAILLAELLTLEGYIHNR